ncbi:MAG: ABC transporter permease [Candidatus Hodarchaeales archaeon]
MFKIAYIYIKKAKLQALFIVLGIACAIALETGVLITVDTIYNDFILDNRNQNFSDIIVTPDHFIDESELKTLTEDLSQFEGVEDASISYYIPLDRFTDQINASRRVFLFGIDPENHIDMPNVNVMEGELDLTENNIVLSHIILESLNLTVGDNFFIEPDSEIGFKGINATIVGVTPNSLFFANKIGVAFIFMDIEKLQSVFLEEFLSVTLIEEVDVKVSDITEIQIVADKILLKYQSGFFISVEKRISSIQKLGLQAYQAALTFVILMTFIVELLFMANILGINTYRRRREYGLMISGGMSRSQLFRLIMYEISFYSILGSIIGVVSGLFFSDFLVSIIDDVYPTISFEQIIINPINPIVSFLTGLGLGIFLGIYTFYLIYRVPVVNSIYNHQESDKRSVFVRHTPSIAITGGILIFFGFILSLTVGPSNELEFSLFSSYFLFVVIFFIGLIIFQASLLALVPKYGGKLLFGIDEFSRIFSLKMISRNYNKALLSFLSINIAVTSVIIVSIVTSGLTASAPAYYTEEWGGLDLVLETRDSLPLPADFTENLTQNYPVSMISYIQERRAFVNGTPSSVFGVSPNDYEVFQEEIFIKSNDNQSIKDYLLYNQNETNDEIYTVVTSTLLQRLGLEVNDKLIVDYNNQTLTAEIKAVIKPNPFLGKSDYMYISSLQWENLFNSTDAKYFLLDLNNEAPNARDTGGFIRGNYTSIGSILSIDIFRENLESSLLFQSNLFNVIIFETLIFASLAQFFSVQISTIVAEKDFSILRAIGIQKKQILNILLLEVLIVGLFASLLGILDGIIGSILFRSYVLNFIPFNLEFPILTFLLYLFIVVGLILLSTVRPAINASEKRIVDIFSEIPKPKFSRFDEYKYREDLLYPRYYRWAKRSIFGGILFFAIAFGYVVYMVLSAIMNINVIFLP